MKTDSGKCHLLMSTYICISIVIQYFDIKNGSEQKVFGIKLDNKLALENHVGPPCKTANQKLIALNRISNYQPPEKSRMFNEAYTYF